ncbi:MAG TPA: NUDIX hydrolase [Clostridiales bacterium]|nr:NUDIX hydrolase [Clostridiales bacterium]
MKTLSRQEIFNGKIIKVYKDDVLLSNGASTTREVVYHREAAAVAAVDENNEILMVTQYRYAVGEELLELPAGLMDEGENPLETAKRELKEETGYEASEWKLLTITYTSPGCHNEKIHIFSASGLKKVCGQCLDEDEILTCKKVPLEEALNMIKTGTIKDSKSVIGILMYLYNK